MAASFIVWERELKKIWNCDVEKKDRWKNMIFSEIGNNHLRCCFVGQMEENVFKIDKKVRLIALTPLILYVAFQMQTDYFVSPMENEVHLIKTDERLRLSFPKPF